MGFHPADPSRQSGHRPLPELWTLYNQWVDFSKEPSTLSLREGAKHVLYTTKVRLFEWITAATLDHHNLHHTADLYREAQALYRPPQTDHFSTRFKALKVLTGISYKDLAEGMGGNVSWVQYYIRETRSLTALQISRIKSSFSKPFVQFLLNEGPLPPPGFPVFVPEGDTVPPQMMALGAYAHRCEQALTRLEDGADKEFIRFDALRLIAGYDFQTDLCRLLKIGPFYIHYSLSDRSDDLPPLLRFTLENVLSPEALAFLNGTGPLPQASDRIFNTTDYQPPDPESFSYERFQELKDHFDTGRSGRWAIGSFEDWAQFLIQFDGVSEQGVLFRIDRDRYPLTRTQLELCRSRAFTPEAMAYLMNSEEASIPPVDRIFKFQPTLADRFMEAARDFNDGVDSKEALERFRIVLDALHEAFTGRHNAWKASTFHRVLSLMAHSLTRRFRPRFETAFTPEAIAYMQGETDELPATVLKPGDFLELARDLAALDEPLKTPYKIPQRLLAKRLRATLSVLNVEPTDFHWDCMTYLRASEVEAIHNLERALSLEIFLKGLQGNTNLFTKARWRVLEMIFSPQTLAHLQGILNDRPAVPLPPAGQILSEGFQQFLSSK